MEFECQQYFHNNNFLTAVKLVLNFSF